MKAELLIKAKEFGSGTNGKVRYNKCLTYFSIGDNIERMLFLESVCKLLATNWNDH